VVAGFGPCCAHPVSPWSSAATIRATPIGPRITVDPSPCRASHQRRTWVPNDPVKAGTPKPR